MMATSYKEQYEFSKEFGRLAKKYRSLYDDLLEFKKILSFSPLGSGKQFNVITSGNGYKVIKARLFCRYLKRSSMRIIYCYNSKLNIIDFIEIYFKGNKESENRERIISYLKKYQNNNL